eukprot:2060874-Rhodomonas_salina.1
MSEADTVHEFPGHQAQTTPWDGTLCAFPCTTLGSFSKGEANTALNSVGSLGGIASMPFVSHSRVRMDLSLQPMSIWDRL